VVITFLHSCPTANVRNASCTTVANSGGYNTQISIYRSDYSPSSVYQDGQESFATFSTTHIWCWHWHRHASLIFGSCEERMEAGRSKGATRIVYYSGCV